MILVAPLMNTSVLKIAPPAASNGPATAVIRKYQKEWAQQDIAQSEEDSRQRDVVAVMDAAAGAGVKSLKVLPLTRKKTMSR